MTTSANEKYKCPNGIHHMKTNGIKCVICGEITRTPVNDRHKDNDCDYGKVIEGFHTDDCTCPTPAKEWEYKVNDIMKRCKDGEMGTHLEMEELVHSLLNQHSAHLVERLKKEIAIHKEIMRIHEGEIFPKSWHEGKIEAFDLAIDIINNKTE